MSWIQKLYETYNNCEAAIGYSTEENKRPLLPICHITAQANIEVVIDGNGNFLKANLVTDANEATTIIPCTEGSASRSGRKPECHPLCDNLQYVASDFEKYGGTVTSGFSEEGTITKDKIEKASLKWKDVFKMLNTNQWIEKKDKEKYLLKANIENEKENFKSILGDDFQKIISCFHQSEPYMDYVRTLTAWCESEYKHPKAQAVLNYVNKQSLIKDLVENKILFMDDNGKLLTRRQTKKDKKAPPDIFDLTKSKQDKAFIRWIVESGDLESKIWKDKTIWESWSQFYLSTRKQEPLCYVKGENALLATQHPKYIRAKGDGAKLISSNDKSGFTYRGRFTDKAGKQACSVSLEVSQKAHNALIWLISRQGKVFLEG
jgi:CRISPR-associated protein Csd1